MIEKQALIYADLLAAQALAYTPNGLVCADLSPEVESQTYGACEFKINSYRIKFRIAKITPTKIGQFVTLWKRVDNGPILPFDLADPIDFFVISVRREKQFGQFIFPKTVLQQKDFVSKNGKGGKRAMRVYPPWDLADSLQAKKTQTWQRLYFVEIAPDIDMAKIKKLLA